MAAAVSTMVPAAVSVASVEESEEDAEQPEEQEEAAPATAGGGEHLHRLVQQLELREEQPLGSGSRSTSSSCSTSSSSGGRVHEQEQQTEAQGGGEEQHSLQALLAASDNFDWSAVEGADADASSRLEPAAAGAAAEDWRGGSSQKQRTQPAPAARQPATSQIVGWDGEWVCSCGERHGATRDCKVCATLGPCRQVTLSGSLKMDGMGACLRALLACPILLCVCATKKCHSGCSMMLS